MTRMRADAEENRRRLIDAARELIADTGFAVTMRQVARRAGLGPATLYRHFPTKHDLVLAAFRDELAACRAIVREESRDPDAWRGFRSVIERVGLLNARNQGFTDAFLAEYPDAFDVASHRSEMSRELATLARRAQAQGGLRADFSVDDLLIVLLAGRGLSAAPAGVRVAAARRFAALTIEGFRADRGNTALPPRAGLSGAGLVSGAPAERDPSRRHPAGQRARQGPRS